jgi:4-hydroxybenzoate polyprenyltransferase
LNLIYILIFLFVFLKFLPNTIFFDLKDIKSDRKEGLKTVPVILGKKGTLKLLHILNILAFIPLFLGICLGIIPLFAAIMVLFYFYSIYYLNKASKLEDEKLRMISYTLADAEFMIWPIVLVLGQFLFSVI